MDGISRVIPVFVPGRIQAVAMGASTGGPGLLRQIISGLPADLPFPILIAQHLPAAFTLQWSQQMAAESALAVVQAEQGMAVLPGVVYVAPGGQHMQLIRSITGHPGVKVAVQISDQPAGLFYKPSVDELLLSVANLFGRHSLAVVMTGIGQDGTKGAAAIKKAGGSVVTQTAQTCSVYGMPQSCDEAGLSDASLSPEEIRQMILQLSPKHRFDRTGMAIR